MSARGVAVVTGASSGFGMLSSVELAKAGFKVYATMRTPSKRAKLDEVAAAASVADRVEVAKLDVDSDRSVAEAFAAIQNAEGRVDVLVSNAGYGVGGFVEDTSMKEYKDQFETNFFGAVRVTKAVLPGMRERKQGRIVLISSIGAFNVVPGLSAYNATKAALESFGEALRYEVVHDGVFVTLIEPGTYPTDIFFDNARYAEGMRDPTSPNYDASKRMEDFAMKMVERRKGADPGEVARKVRAVATMKRPRLRYLVGTDAKIIKPLRAVTPTRATEKVVGKILHG
jgi:NAD(P)-dependent dehydrogenase (short-subunit alcohol dehydrogenase family)